MKIIRLILFPVVPIYYLVTKLRNWLYDIGIKTSKSYRFPVICVGNLSTGGTGKTPMIEYLIQLLKGDYQLATLSRGYKRKSRGFVLGDNTTNAETLGDEPFQFFKKFDDIRVAVDENRQNGIELLRKLNPQPEVILLDDAFQHRKVKAGFNILLTSFDNLFYKDIVLPTGNLREPQSGYKRADCIVVTKCPKNLSDLEKTNIVNGVNPVESQHVFFSSIRYSKNVYSINNEMVLTDLPEFTLVTGIANPKPLVSHLKNLGLRFKHLEFNDHYNFTESDIIKLNGKELILTTEKDFVRLNRYESLNDKLYYLPIEIKIDDSEKFARIVNKAIS